MPKASSIAPLFGTTSVDAAADLLFGNKKVTGQLPAAPPFNWQSHIPDLYIAAIAFVNAGIAPPGFACSFGAMRSVIIAVSNALREPV